MAPHLHTPWEARRWRHWALAWTWVSVMFSGCQPIEQEPPAPTPVNSPPVLDLTKVKPTSTVVHIKASLTGSCDDVRFELGEVRDQDLDQTLTARWFRDFVDPNDATQHFPDGGQLIPTQDGVLEVTLQRYPNDPARAADTPGVYGIPQTIVKSWGVGEPHTVTVFVSDGFAGNITQSPSQAREGRDVVQHAWVVLKDEQCGEVLP